MMMGASKSKSISVTNSNSEDPKLGLQCSQSPNPDLDHAPLDPNHAAEVDSDAIQDKLQHLDLKDISEAVLKEEAEKDGNWDLKEADEAREAEEVKGDSNWEEVRACEREWNGWDDNGNDNEIVVDKVVVEEGGEEKDSDDRNGNPVTNKYQYPVRPDAEDCSFYLKTGTCKFGANCRFNHPVRRKSQAVKEKVKEWDESTEKPGQTECKYYLSSGGCKYGKACRYSHSKGKTSGTTLLELNFLGLPIRLGEKECPYYMRTGSCKYGANCRFNHPDPTAVGGSDNASGFGNGESAALDALQSSLTSWSSPRTLNETAPFVPMVPSPMHPQSPEWNGYQAPVYPPERSIHLPVTYVMSPTPAETNLYTRHQQQIQVEEYPERPGQPECSYFLKTGDCKFKSNCKYHHPKDGMVKSLPCALSDKGLPLRPDQNICSHYSRYGICKFGPACKFDHPIHPASLPATRLDQHPSFGSSVTTERVGVPGSGSEATLQQPV